MRHFAIEEVTPVPPVQALPFFPCMIVVQARMGSTRLPGKVMRKVLGRPLLSYLIERLRKVRGVDGIIIATSQNKADDSIAEFCDAEALHVVRQSEDDVLSRFYTAATLFDLKALIRITADCPLIDPGIIEKGLFCFAAHYKSLDYLSNCLKRSFPRGMDFEIMRKSALEKAYFEATSLYEKEHVTPFIARNPQMFHLANLEQKNNQSQYRLTVDQEEDFTLIERIIETLYPKNPEFTLEDIVQMLTIHSDWLQINANVKQKS